MSKKVAVVTGSNKGIGFAIVKGLSEKFDGIVYLTSRDNSRGLTTLDDLKKQGCNNVEYHQLDVADESSVRVFSDYIKNRHGGIDVLINNAAIANAGSYKEIDYDVCKEIIDINYKSLFNIKKYVYPLLRDNARVVNISSDCGHLSNVRNKKWLEIFTKKEFTVDDINSFVDWFLKTVKDGTFNRDDFADNSSFVAYRVSKVAMSALTIVQQKELEKRGISINSMHPGLVRTDMTRGVGFYSIEDAAKTPVYLALEAPSSVKGQYVWYDGKILDWYNYNADYYFKASVFD